VVDQRAALIARLRQPVPLSSPRGVLAANAGRTSLARDAATVVLLRDAPVGGIEAYLVGRVATMAFAGGVFAFPGGRVDAADRAAPGSGGVPGGWAGPPLGALLGMLEPDPELARALVCAAIRETFEECGVLLAAASDGAPLDVAGPAWRADRQAMERRELGLAELLARHGLVPRTDLLAPWARWITPEIEPRRYDTRFFLAALPSGQQPGELSGEADRMAWLRPAEALERHAAGRLPMLPPTAWMLADLLPYATVTDALGAARGRAITPVLPKIVIADGAAHFLLPHDPEYATAAPPADPDSATALIVATATGRDNAGNGDAAAPQA
jgi:8-oxo-dGTP pyrophosphatase MutT (NUDIX family)